MAPRQRAYLLTVSRSRHTKEALYEAVCTMPAVITHYCGVVEMHGVSEEEATSDDVPLPAGVPADGPAQDEPEDAPAAEVEVGQPAAPPAQVVLAGAQEDYPPLREPEDAAEEEAGGEQPAAPHAQVVVDTHLHAAVLFADKVRANVLAPHSVTSFVNE
jgi:hypothetical protein